MLVSDAPHAVIQQQECRDPRKGCLQCNHAVYMERSTAAMVGLFCYEAAAAAGVVAATTVAMQSASPLATGQRTTGRRLLQGASAAPPGGNERRPFPALLLALQAAAAARTRQYALSPCHGGARQSARL